MVFFGTFFLSGFDFGFGLLLFAGSLFLACGGGGGASPRFCLSSRSAALPRRIDFGDQFVGQNQPRVGDIFHDQHDVGIFARARVIAM